MVGWQRHLQCALRQVGRRLEHNHTHSANYSSSISRLNSFVLAAEFDNHTHSANYSSSISRLNSFVLAGDSASIQRLWRSPSAGISTPLYQFFQQLGISTSRKLLAGSSEETPISSPLTPVLAISGEKTEEKKVGPKRTEVQAVLKKIKQSPKKVNLVAALVRGMRVEDALLQLQVTVKRAAKTVYQVIHSARANATHNHGLDPDRLLVAEAFLGKGRFLKRVSYHGKGRSGIKERPECRLTVVVREMTAEEEAEIAKLRVRNFRKLTKREKRLVPHQLIETTPIWNRKGRGNGKGSNQEANGMAA